MSGCGVYYFSWRRSIFRSPFKPKMKQTFLRFFYFGPVSFTFLTLFFIFQTFFILKNVGKVQSSKQVNKKHFQNNSNEIDL